MPISFPRSASSLGHHVDMDPSPQPQPQPSSGRKSPDPFKRFRRLSSANSLSTDSNSSSTNSRIPPPKPSPSTKPAFIRHRITRSGSFSFRNNSSNNNNESDSPALTPSNSASSLAQPSIGADPTATATATASASASSPSSSSSFTKSPRSRLASLSSKLHARHDSNASSAPRSFPALASASSEHVPNDSHAAPSGLGLGGGGSGSPSSTATITSTGTSGSPSQPRKPTQAWYQAQQKTISLDQPGYRSAAHPPTTSTSTSSSSFSSIDTTSDSATIPRSITTSNTSNPISTPPLGTSRIPLLHRRKPSASSSNVIDQFMSEQEMIAAGVQIIRRQDPAPQLPLSLEPSSSTLPHTERLTSSPRDGLGIVSSNGNPNNSSASTSTLPAVPPRPARLQGAGDPDFLELLHSDPAITARDGRRSLDRGSLRSFSANAATNGIGMVSPVIEDRTDNLWDQPLRSPPLALPPRPSTSLSFHAHHSSSSLSSLAGSSSANGHTLRGVRETSPSYLSPGPSTSAHPFLNKQSATVGKAAGMGTGANGPSSARNGLANFFSGVTSEQYQTSTTRRSLDHTGRPAVPARPRPGLLGSFARSPSGNNLSTDSMPVREKGTLSSPGAWNGGGGLGPASPLPDPPRSAAAIMGRGEQDQTFPRSPSGSSTLQPPPRRAASVARPTAYSPNSTGGGGAAGPGGGGVATALGQLGAAVGRKGWDFVRTFNSGGGTGAAVKSGIPVRVDPSLAARQASAAGATRVWLTALADESDRPAGPGRNMFGVPLREAVLRSRIGGNKTRAGGMSGASVTGFGTGHLSIPDLGNQFSLGINLFDSNEGLASKRQSVRIASRADARRFYLPCLVVRCIESLEKWGPQEEGIYRLSGRSSHTAKLRAILDDAGADLQLDEISPADLDINSVCSVLKSYLRELPLPLLAPELATRLEEGEVELGQALRQMPAPNWYLLRELAEHLGWLAGPEIVTETKMPLSNLCLVLAPTLSLSVSLLKRLIEERGKVFGALGPAADSELDRVWLSQSQVQVQVHAPSPKPKVPAKPSKLPPRPSTALGHSTDSAPIASYFSRMRLDEDDESDDSRSVSNSSGTIGTGAGAGAAGGALDRPRPPTSGLGNSFFSGRSRRTDSVNLQ